MILTRRALGQPRSTPTIAYPATLLLLGVTLAAAGIAAQSTVAAELTRATTSRAARDDSIRAIPFEHMVGHERDEVAAVVQRAEIFRRMPVEVIDCDPSLFNFLVGHPEVVVNIWHVMGVTKIKVSRASDGSLVADDGSGTQGRVRYAYAGGDTHVLLADGSYSGALMAKPVRGQSVLVLKCTPHRSPDGRSYLTCRLDAFIDVHNAGLEILVKGLHPVMGAIADHNFRETTAFVSSLGRAAEANPDGVVRLCSRLTQVEPRHRDQLIQITANLARRAASAEDDAGGYDSTSNATRVASPPLVRSTVD